MQMAITFKEPFKLKNTRVYSIILKNGEKEKYMKKIIYLTIAFVFTSATAVFSWDFIPAMDLTGGITYPTVVSNESAELDKKLGVDSAFAGSFMVNTDFLPQLWLIPTLTANYSSTARPLNVEDERFLFTLWLDTYISYGFNYEFTESWEARLRFFHRLDYAQQTADETFGTGLYDYKDNGFYIENVNYTGSGESPAEITEGFKYIDRRFPNYTLLITQLEPGELGYETPNTYSKEKDSLTYNFYLMADVKWGESKWYTSAKIMYEYIPYLEQKIIEPDGSFSGAKRIDRYLTIDFDFPYYAGEVSGIEFGYELIFRTTDQNYYDTLGDIDPSNDVFTENFYNYAEHILSMSFIYEFPMKLLTDFKPVSVLNFSADFVKYSDRKAKDAEGNYTNRNHDENNYTLSLDIKQNITDFWNYYINGSFTRYSSNTKWEAYGAYNYNYLTVSMGTGISF